VLLGGTGNDTLHGGTGPGAALGGEAGDDVLNGSDGIDVLIGGAGADSLFGGKGDDRLSGDSGLKVIGLVISGDTVADYDFVSDVVAPGDDLFDGGDGFDTVSYALSKTAIDASLGKGIAIGEGTDRLIEIEGLIGSRFADTLEGSSEDDLLAGGDGDDVIRGLAGNDTIFGDAGADHVDGGSGIDVVYFDSVVRLVLRAEKLMANKVLYTTLLGSGDAEGDTYINVEKFATADAAGNIEIRGQGSADLAGGTGADRFTGGGGRDRLDGGAGNDTLIGGNGSDILTGGMGADWLTGGKGADRFVFASAEDSTPAKLGRDTITDFAGQDRIVLAAIDADVGTAGNQAFDFIGTSRFSGKAGELRYQVVKETTLIQADIDGDRQADFALLLDDVVTMLDGYFVL
jgi:serralysin